MPFMKPYMVKLLREQFPPGTRIRLDSMMNDPQPIPKGMCRALTMLVSF